MTRRPRTNASCRSCTRIVPTVNAAGLCPQCVPPAAPPNRDAIRAEIRRLEAELTGLENADRHQARHIANVMHKLLLQYRAFVANVEIPQ